ncbi:MAG: NUDIX domain-containing protein [Bdellovibrionales bacterium]|nr:NUDIX domain-containing protein [Bdellovibrionales bacterium]
MIRKSKVLAYIFRENEGVRELLVFDHRDYPNVNPQVPAGTVESDESLEEAVLREVYEESGVELEVEPSYLGSYDYQHDEKYQLHQRHVYSFNVSGLPSNWEHRISEGQEDKGLIFDFYWIAIDEAREALVADMGKYLP